MPRFITVTVGCDWTECTVEAPEGDERILTKTVAIDGKQAKQFLVCKSHLEDFEAVVMPLMQAGVKVEAPKRSPRSSASGSAASPSAEPGPGRNDVGKIDCQVDGCPRVGSRGLSNRTGMAQHAIRTHDYDTLADYEAEHGAVD